MGCTPTRFGSRASMEATAGSVCFYFSARDIERQVALRDVVDRREPVRGRPAPERLGPALGRAPVDAPLPYARGDFHNLGVRRLQRCGEASDRTPSSDSRNERRARPALIISDFPQNNLSRLFGIRTASSYLNAFSVRRLARARYSSATHRLCSKEFEMLATADGTAGRAVMWELAGWQGFELGARPVSNVVTARDFWF
jgi:hypothetical protein